MRWTIRLASGVAMATLAILPTMLTPAAAGPTQRPTADERAQYWLDRIVLGPEPTSYLIQNFHQSLLSDAIRNLAETPDETLALLANPQLRARIQSQSDANPWFGILAVLATIGAKKAEVARAWAVPAIESGLLTLRRAAVPVVSLLSSPADAPVLLEALARDAEDRVLAPALAKALFAIGKPFDGEALRLLLEGGVADQALGECAAWIEAAPALAEVRGGARPDLLAWWALLLEPVAPRWKNASGGSRPLPSDVSTSPPDAVYGTGKSAAAGARADLMMRGFAAYEASVRADASGGDDVLAVVARDVLARTGDAARRADLRLEAPAWLDALAGRPIPTSEEAFDLAAQAGRFVTALRADDAPEARLLLERFLRELPPQRFFTPPIENAFGALMLRGADPESIARQWFSSGDPALVDRAVAVVRHTKSRSLAPFLLTYMETPAAAKRRPELRRLALLLVTFSLSHGGIEGAELAQWAKAVAEWARDPSDPSARGFLGALLELRQFGEAQIAEGLRGSDRDAYVELLLRPFGRYLGSEVISALLAPIGPSTNVPERRRTLDATFAVAGGESAPLISALVRRLPVEDRPDAEMVLRIVRFRAPSVP